MTPSAPDWRRAAAELVVHFHKSTGQAARIFGCSISAVQECIAEYIRQHDVASKASSDDPVFIPVALEDDVSSDNEQPGFSFTPLPIPVEIVTSSGLTLRLSPVSLDEIAHLIHSLEAKPC
jgi:hypothetical protein